MRHRLFVGVACAALVSGCGGGGGSGASPPGSATIPATPVAPAPTPTPPPISSTSYQRQDASQALSALNGARNAVVYGNPGSSTALSLRRQIETAGARVTAAFARGDRVTSGARRSDAVTYSACSNGVESALVTVSSTEIQVYGRDFYDAACTQLFLDIFFDITATSSTAAQGGGTLAAYTKSGTMYDYEVIGLAISGVGTGSGAFAVLGTDAPNSTAPITAKVGIACGISSTNLNCGFGGVARETALNADLGALLSLDASISSSGATVSVPISGSGSTYAGALGTLGLAGTSSQPFFSVTNGTLTDSGTLNGTLAFTQAGLVTGGTLTVTDAAADGTVTVTASGSTISGVIQRTDTGATVATFTVDANGNGTIAYGNGATGQILNWAIFG